MATSAVFPETGNRKAASATELKHPYNNFRHLTEGTGLCFVKLIIFHHFRREDNTYRLDAVYWYWWWYLFRLFIILYTDTCLTVTTISSIYSSVVCMMLMRTVPHDTTDDVVENFLSKILPGSGTVYRSDWHRRSTVASWKLGERTTSSSRLDTARGITASDDSRPPAAATKRRVCTSVPMDTNAARVQMKTICFHVSNGLLALDDPTETQLKALANV